MSEKKTIIFTSAYSYLSNPQYFSFVDKLSKVKKVYLHVKDPLSVEFDDKLVKKDEILRYFDEYIEIDYNLKEELLKVYEERQGFWRRLSFKTIKPYYDYKKLLLSNLDQIKPDAIVTCSDMTVSDRVISSWCRKKRKSHIILQNCFIDDINYAKYKFRHKVRYFFFNKLLRAPLYRKQHLYGSENYRSHLLLWSDYYILDSNRKNTHFIGNAVFDKLFQQFSDKKKKADIITICTQPLDELFSVKIFDEVNKYFKIALEKFPDVSFHMKVHPREEISKYQKIFPEKKYPNVKVIKDYNLHELFMKSFGQISINSFTSFEAAALGIPVIIINPNDEINTYDHFREEIDIRIRKPEEISEAIKTIQSNDYWELFLKKREKYFKKMLHFIDGKSNERTAAKIRELAA
ncbi:MAG: hypothetical protein ACTSSK_06970 [Candidatus Heimdallarchaeota archaeon]